MITVRVMRILFWKNLVMKQAQKVMLQMRKLTTRLMLRFCPLLLLPGMAVMQVTGACSKCANFVNILSYFSILCFCCYTLYASSRYLQNACVFS